MSNESVVQIAADFSSKDGISISDIRPSDQAISLESIPDNSSSTYLNQMAETNLSCKEELKSSSIGSCSRYGRARAVPNFARMIDPLSTRGVSHSSDRSVGLPGSDESPSKSFSSLVERVQELLSKIGVTVLAPPLDSLVTPQPGSEKYIGVRSKHVGIARRFSAVIKKNHSEIHLGVYNTAAEVFLYVANCE